MSRSAPPSAAPSAPERPTNLLVLGRAGTGKGTLARGLSAALNLATFDMGATLRRYAAAEDPALAAHLARGGMAESALVVRLLAKGVAARVPGTTGWLIDGMPRKVDQADAIIAGFEDGSMPLTAAIILEAPTEVLLERLSGRWLCGGGCGAIYNAVQGLPAEGRCPCGAALTQRKDDSPEGIQERFRLFELETAPALARLEASLLPVLHLAADRPAEVVLADALARVRALTTLPGARARTRPAGLASGRTLR